ncbi:MAG: DNA recombination protein RmuC [Prevotella sp.]|jgi:DNA recombination protein RmuC
MYILFLILGIAIGAVCGYLYANNNSAGMKTKAEMLQQTQEQLNTQLSEAREQTERLTSELSSATAAKKVVEAQLNSAREDFKTQKADLMAQHNAQLEELRRQQKEQLEKQSQLIREQINTASEDILKKRAEELSSTNKQQLDSLLNPLQNSLKQMRESVEQSNKDRIASLENLSATIRANQKQAEALGERADKLTEALTGETKKQGNFGELRLHTLLENMGLQEGLQYEEQSTMKDNGDALRDEETGRKKIPDVVLHFPDNRDVIIDSKMSLTALNDYYNATNDEQREDALRRHIASVRKHVDELAKQRYQFYTPKGKKTLDFVMMYIYNEGGLQLALAKDPTLWKDAYDKGVIISGSQTLYMMLRVLEMTWHQVKQAENQEEIMQAANDIINRVQLFYERFKVADEQLDKTVKAFNEVKTSTAPSGQSITTAARKLLKYGATENAKRKYKLPRSSEDDEGLSESIESQEES